MRSPLLVLAALGMVSAAAAADPMDHETAPAPLVLTAAQLDGVTAGIALLLPAVQKARLEGLLPGLSGGGFAVLAPVAQCSWPPCPRDTVFPPRPVVIWF